MSKRATLVWVDAQTESQLNVITTDLGVGGIEAALENHSSAVVATCSEGILEISSAIPATTTYATCRVNAALRFSDGLGSVATVYIPAPNENIFLSDGVSVDQTMITDIITACIGNLLAGSGNVVTNYLGGEMYRGRILNGSRPS